MKTALDFTYRDLSRQLVPGVEGIEVRFTAEFTIRQAGQVIFQDDAFDVVAFAMASQAWATGVTSVGFEFDGVEISQRGAAWFVAAARCELEEIVDALDLFYSRLRRQIADEFGFDLDALFTRGGRTARRNLQ
jgi:hypothetical protein